MKKYLFLLYGVICYVLFLVAFLYAIGFMGDLLVPRSIDSEVTSPFGKALLINAVLLGIFAVQHSVMARPAFKEWWTKIVPTPIERSTYVLFTSLLLGLIFWKWEPMGGIVWDAGDGTLATVLIAIFFIGWVIVLISTFLINHFDLFGLRQVWLYFNGKEYTHLKFTKTGLYKVVRHPILLGFIIAFWATPKMTVAHFVFAVATTVYMLMEMII
jgi:protein-S-isoprenylcysteine O-methyltransferase Ste14